MVQQSEPVRGDERVESVLALLLAEERERGRTHYEVEEPLLQEGHLLRCGWWSLTALLNLGETVSGTHDRIGKNFLQFASIIRGF